MSAERIVVVGAGLAGGRSCSALRQAGFDGEIVLIGEEKHRPYDRPPLSKEPWSASWTPPLTLTSGSSVSTCIWVSMSSPWTCRGRLWAPPPARSSTTGWLWRRGRCRSGSPVPGKGDQVCLRTRESAEAVRSGLRPDATIVLIGAGWIGAELATAALAAGSRVICLEAGAAPVI